MATSRPIRVGEWLTHLSGPHIGGNYTAKGDEHTPNFVLQADFGLDMLGGDEYRSRVCTRVFGLHPSATDASLAAAITNGTAPGLYVREGDDTSNWEVYREVLARRVNEAMAARRGGVVGVETTATVGETAAPLIRECHWCYNSRRITHSQDDEGRVCSYCFDWPEVAQAREDAAALAAARAMPTATTRQDDEIRVGDVVEVVSCSDIHYTNRGDIGSGGRITRRGDNSVQLVRFDSMRLPGGGVAAIGDVRKVTSSPSSLITVAANVSPMPDVQPPMPLSRPAHQPAPPQPSSPSRFSLLEVDADVKPPAPQAPKASTGLAALQQELRAEREAKRALAAAHTPPGRFNLLECDLPAVAVKAPTKHPVVSSPSPKPLSPVETITDLTAARSPLELARMLAGLDEELSTMMRQREAN